MRILFLGPPGAGKDTQAAILANQWQIAYISVDELVNRAIDRRTSIGQAIQPYVAMGETVPDHLVLQLLRDRLRQSDVHQGWVLNGFPQTITQADSFDRLLGEFKQTCDRIISFYVSVDVLIQRNRAIKQEAVFQNQLAIYYEQTIPLIHHYRRREGFVVINGDRPIADVTHLLNTSLQGLIPA